jgi:hypothetical protein
MLLASDVADVDQGIPAVRDNRPHSIREGSGPPGVLVRPEEHRGRLRRLLVPQWANLAWLEACQREGAHL